MKKSFQWKNKLRHQWNEEVINIGYTILQEDEVLRELVKHFGENFIEISSQMNLIYVEYRWTLQKNPTINWNPLSSEETKKLVDIITKQIGIAKTSFKLWVTIAKQFKNRTASLLRNRLKSILNFVLRRLNLFYGHPENQKIYHARIGVISDITYQMIFILEQQQISRFKDNEHLFLIVNSCKLIVPIIKIFIDKDLINKDDIKYYFDQRQFRDLPELSCEQFENMMEPLFLLEQVNLSCVNRISFSNVPYNYDYIAEKKTSIKNALKMKKLFKSRIDPFEQRNVPLQELYAQCDNKYRVFTSLNLEQIEYIKESELVKGLWRYQQIFTIDQ